MPQPSLGPPFRAFPSYESRTSLEAACSLVVIHLRSKCAARGLITSGFPDTHAHAQQPGSSGGYELPFHAPKHASWSPWTPLDGFTRPASFTYFEALFLLRVRSRRAGLPHFDGRYSRVSSPL